MLSTLIFIFHIFIFIQNKIILGVQCSNCPLFLRYRYSYESFFSMNLFSHCYIMFQPIIFSIFIGIHIFSLEWNLKNFWMHDFLVFLSASHFNFVFFVKCLFKCLDFIILWFIVQRGPKEPYYLPNPLI